MYDVVVIGAGPAGSITAERLAARGRRVALIEEHPEVGAPVHCTGLVGPEAFDEYDLPRHLILGESGAATFWGANGQSVQIGGGVRAVVLERSALDRTLSERAMAQGAELRVGVRAERIVVGPRSVRVAATGLERDLEARACVLACGANYRFHRALGLGMPEVFLQSAQLDTQFPAVAEVEVRFGRDIAPGGFAWVVPFRRDGQSYARIGLMSQTNALSHFKTFAGHLALRSGIDASDLPSPRLKMLPLAPVARTYGHRVLAVGDAAGLVKPTTGGGIYYGLISGAIAADVLDRGLERDRLAARDLAAYQTGWRRTLGREIRVGLAFRKIASRLSDESIDALIDLARTNGIVPLMQKNASFNWHSKTALALLGHPSFRRIALRTWAGTGDVV